MIEIELKFQISPARRTALLKALDPKKSEIIQLQAKYFDTPDRLLAQHGAALRQRLEGAQWIQTFKAAGKSHLHRFEHNQPLNESEVLTELNLDLYSDVPEAQQILTQTLGTDLTGLELIFETDIQRTFRMMQFEDAEIEVCLDVGVIRASGREQQIHEVEFELKSGNIQTLLAFSFEWVKKYHLWLDVRSKAEMGNLLARNQAVSPARLDNEFILAKKESAAHNLRLLIGQQMQHLLPNIAAISAGVAEQNHIDQAQLALDHLQLSLTLFKHWNPLISDKWAMQLAAFKHQFDQLQHLQHMQNTLAGFLQNPTTRENLAKDILYMQEKLGHLVKSTQNVHHYLELLTFSLSSYEQEEKQDLKTYAYNTLQTQYRQLQESLNTANINDLESLDGLAQSIKALKFSFPILTSIYDVKHLQKYSKALNDAQQAAQEYQILSSFAEYIQQTELEASDWFVLGWLTAKLEVYAKQLVETTAQFLVSRKFLK